MNKKQQPMTQQALIDDLAESLQCSRLKAHDFLTTYHGIACEQLTQQGCFSLKGIGTMRNVNRKERQGRNPRTGESLTIPEHQTVTFKISSSLAKLINR